MSLLAWFGKFIGDRLAAQNANKVLERLGLDRMLVKLFPSRQRSMPYLHHAVVVSADRDRPPEFRARFGRDGNEGVFYLEYRMETGGMGWDAGWTMPRKIEVASQPRFASGMTIEFPIIGKLDHDREGPMWFFGNQADMVQGYPRDSLNPHWRYQGRITFQTDDGSSQHCYFIVATQERADMPVVTGEHMFSHVWEWEGRPLPNIDPTALFK